MCRKVICFTSAVLLLSLTGNASADLVAYWAFDEGSGDIAYDSSGNGNNGTINGAQWGDGRHGSALSFNGTDNYVEVPSSPSLEIDGPVTMAAWINWIDAGDGWQTVMTKGPMSGPGENYAVFVNLGGRYFHFALAADGGRVTHNSPNGSVVPNEWLHVCCTADGSVARIYIDGEIATEVVQTGGLVPQELPLRIGHRDGSSHYWNGMIDEVRVYNHALTEAEIAILAARENAEKPDPADGAKVDATWVSLGWRPGDFSVSSDVYMSENFDDVKSAAAAAFQGNYPTPPMVVGFFGFPFPDGLVPGTTYYWRVDAINEADPNSPWEGDVWSFWVPPKKAYEPTVSDGAKFVMTDVELGWTAGFGAMLHTVYFGDDLDIVTNATGGAAQTDTTYTPGTLETDKTYYWRVDEFEAPLTHKGDVWSFTTMPVIPISDPNLIGWWTLDEATLAVDWSGHESHGTFRGDPQPELGYDGGALAFDGQDDYISVPMDVSETAYAAVLWFKTTNANCGVMAVVNTDLGNAHDRHVYLTDGDIGIRLWDNEIIQTGGLNLADGLWHHLVYTYGAGIGGQRVYVDGVLRASGSKNSSDFDWQERVNLGYSHDAASRYFQGVMDDVRIYNKALTQADAQELMRGDPTLAGLPNPSNGATADIFAANNLTWLPGENAAQHDVYFGTDRAAVEAADTTDTTGVYRGRQNLTSYTPPEGIQMNSGPFYWRVDEYNTDGTISSGRIWSFTVGDYGLVDDFESYNDIPEGEEGSNLVYVRYQDGFDNPNVNGSTIGYVAGESMEKANVHGGSQSVPFIYNNTMAAVSEVTLNITPAQDWTAQGIITLSLWFAGDGANVPGQFYVKINGVQVNYDGEMSNLTLDSWQVWNIDLTTVGTNMSTVTSFAFGVQGSAASGTLLLDDIRLYALPRELITPIQPDPAGLVAHFAFDGNANDSSGNNNHGTVMGDAQWVAGGKLGGALAFDGLDDIVVVTQNSGLPIYNNGTDNAYSVAMWVKGGPQNDMRVFSEGSTTNNNPLFNLGTQNAGATGQFDVYIRPVGMGHTYSVAEPFDDTWHHIVWVDENGAARLYIDGRLDGGDFNYTRATLTLDTTTIGGILRAAPSHFFTGQIDDVHIYNRALSHAEIAGLAGRIQPFDAPLGE